MSYRARGHRNRIYQQTLVLVYLVAALIDKVSIHVFVPQQSTLLDIPFIWLDISCG
jgi:hypothetical protein